MRRIATNESKKGFTLTELAVAIVFISILLLTIATVTLNMVHTYHKGNTMKSINTVGLELIAEFSDAISASSNFDYRSYCAMFSSDAYDDCINNKGQKFIFQEFTVDDVHLKDLSDKFRAQKYGIFCSGRYTYIWNTGYTMSSNDGTHTKGSDLYVVDGGGSLDGFSIDSDSTYRLKKYQDPSRSLCTQTFTDPMDYSSNSLNNINIVSLSSPLSEELINTQDLAIFSLVIDPPIIEESTFNSLYTAHLILGSISGGITMDDDNPQCNMDTDSTYDIEYCATNKFNFTMKANGSNNV